MRRRSNGFTIVELLIVVAVIAILAAIAIPNLLMALQRARQKRTMANMRNIATAWEARATDVSKYNGAGTGVDGMSQMVTMDQLEAALQPTYIKALPRTDGWNREFQGMTETPWGGTPSSQRYAIISAARDGVLETSPALGPTSDFDCDIIYSNGLFLQYPDGLQTGR